MLLILVATTVSADVVSDGIGISVISDSSEPDIWLCEDRVLYDGNTNAGRTSGAGEELVKRQQNYAFEGEQVEYTALVMDNEGAEDINHVSMMLDQDGPITQEGPCSIISECDGTPDPDSCQAYDYNQCTNTDGCKSLCDIIVDASGSGDYTLIQDGVDNAPDNGMVCVLGGTYNEQVTIDKPLSLQSWSSPIIYCGGTGTGIDIESSGVTVQRRIIYYLLVQKCLLH